VVDPSVVSLTAPQVAGLDWSNPTWAEETAVRVAAAAWIIESQGQRIVVDPLQAADELLRTGADAALHQEAVAEMLATAGFPRESIDAVIVSHLDGIGMIAWLADDRWSPYFPHAEILVSERELDAITAGGDSRPMGADALEALHRQGAVRTIGDEHRVTDDVTVEWTGGHAPGHQITRIRSGGAEATMIGHLALSPLHFAVPDCTAHIDPPAAGAVIAALRDQDALLIGPLWPTPGAARWIDGRMHPAA
jgi:glyoxylase-like metal-dependent hydrolase (beta-lactamase superfamily II)